MVAEHVSTLRNFEIFKGLPEKTLAALAKDIRWRRKPAGVQIFPAEKAGDEVYFVATGKVRVALSSAQEGRNVLFTVLGPYEMFGELSVIDGEPRSAAVEVDEECQLGSLAAERFLSLIAEHPSFGLAVMKKLAAQIRRLSRRVFEFSTLSVQARVHVELLRLVELAGVKDNQAVLNPAPRLVDIADSITTTREAVAHVIGRLKAQGIVQRAPNPRILRVLDVERLRQFVREAKGE